MVKASVQKKARPQLALFDAVAAIEPEPVPPAAAPEPPASPNPPADKPAPLRTA